MLSYSAGNRTEPGRADLPIGTIADEPIPLLSYTADPNELWMPEKVYRREVSGERDKYTSGISGGVRSELGRLLRADGRVFVFFLVLFFAGCEGIRAGEDGILQYLAVQLGLGERNSSFMQLFFAVFRGFSAGLISFFLFLRFEPNFLFALFGS